MQYIAALFALVAAVAAHDHAGDYNYAAAYRHAHGLKHGMAHNHSVVATAPAHVYVTEVVTELTTVCPYATKLTIGAKTYTVTEATTLTITDCPCTISHKVPAPSAAAAGTGYAPPVAPSVAAPYPTGRPSNCTGSTTATATGPLATHAAPQYTGAASKAGIALLGLAGAGLAALL